MSGKRLLTFGGLAAVGGGAYYLYSAGGDPKLAQKQLERMSPIIVPSNVGRRG